MDEPVDWWWKMSLLDVCIQAGFYQIRSHIQSSQIYEHVVPVKIHLSLYTLHTQAVEVVWLCT